MNAAVFLDRDGTLNQEVGYIDHVSRFRMIPGAAEAVGKINRSGFKAVVVTNQSGVARGYFPESMVIQIHAMLDRLLKEADAFLDGLYYCPHFAQGVIEPYNVACNCRKPKTGMLTKAAADLDIDLKQSYMIGDRLKDIDFAHRVGMKGILVLSGYGRDEAESLTPSSTIKPDYVAEDLDSAVNWILKRVG